MFADDAEALTDIFGAVARLCVRDEFCQQVVDIDGIAIIFATLQKHISNQVVMSRGFFTLVTAVRLFACCARVTQALYDQISSFP